MHLWLRLNFLLIILHLSCGDAPRNNPLDPLNPKYTPPPESPIIDSLFFYSIVGVGGRNNVELKLFVYIDDSNNPVEYLAVTNTSNNETVRLIYTPDEEEYKYTFNNTDLGIDIPDQVIGIRFYLKSIDRQNNIIPMKELEIKRIIKDNVYLVLPGTRDSVNSRPLLTWVSDFDDQPPVARDELDKIYHFKVDIFNEDATIDPIWYKDNLSIKENEIMVDRDLAAGEYRWRVWIFDNFGNRITTQLRKFIVK